jgi:phage terminase small subunit
MTTSATSEKGNLRPQLSQKEEAFCVAIVEGLSASAAYRKAYKPQRAKAKTIYEKASRIMARGKVRARIAELMAPVIAQAQMTRTEWLQRLTRCCRFDPRKMFDAQGKPKRITDLEENESAAREQYEFHTELPAPDGSRKASTVKIKFLDRLTALALLGKACHWYANRQEQTGPNGRPIQNTMIVRFESPRDARESYDQMIKVTPRSESHRAG